MKLHHEAAGVHHAVCLALAAFLTLPWLAFAAAGDDPPKAVAAPKGLVAPAAPILPAEVIDAMQEGRYEAADRLLAALIEKTPSIDDKAYYSYLRGISGRLAGHRDSAREILAKAISLDPKGRWVIKIRYELAGIELASGNWAPAEELARAEAERLLSGDRKDQLAGIYHDYARRLLEPGDPLIAPDPNGAYDLLVQARELAESPALRARLLYTMGRASMAAGNPARAVENDQLYVQEYPAGEDRLAVRFQLGEAQQKTQSAVAGAANVDRSGAGDRAAQAGRAF